MLISKLFQLFVFKFEDLSSVHRKTVEVQNVLEHKAGNMAPWLSMHNDFQF